MVELDNDELPELAPPSDLPLKEGDVVGLLTLVRRAGKSPNGGGALWECRCRCGRVVLRPQVKLTFARRQGTRASCKACVTSTLHRRRSHWVFLAMWKDTGSLYTDRGIDGMTYDIREMSDLPDPVDVPISPFVIDDEGQSAWPMYEDHVEPMTLTEIGEVMGLSRERIRQIEAEALQKLRKAWELSDAEGERKMWDDYVEKHWRSRRRGKPPPVQSEPEPKPKEKAVKPKWDRDNLGVPANCLLAKEAAEVLGWPIHTFHNRSAKMTPAGAVDGPSGRPWSYWSQAQIEELHARYAGKPIPPPAEPKRKPRKVVQVKEPEFNPKESTAFPALLVLRAKVSGISMTMPVYVIQMARMDDGNHQVKVRFAGAARDSILDSTIIVWAKDLLTVDYSPFKTPWDD